MLRRTVAVRIAQLRHALLLSNLVDEGLVDVGNDTTTRDRRLQHGNACCAKSRQDESTM